MPARVRIYLPNGEAKVKVIDETTTLLAFKSMLRLEAGIEPEDMVIAFNGVPPVPLADGDDKLLVSHYKAAGKVLCITNKSDSSKEISAGSAEQDKELSDNSALLNSSVKLDHIDELLVKEGILLQVPNYKGNVPPAVWEFRDYEPWSSRNIIFMPFHPWVKQNKKMLSEDDCRIKSGSKSTSWSDISNKMQVKQQKYRHVDIVEFEHQHIFDSFTQATITTDEQQFGWMYGRYEKDPNIPQGVKAVVCAIYTPSDWSETPEDEIKVRDEVAKMLGLQRVGWIFTQLGASQEDRYKHKPPHTAQELWHVAKFQRQFPRAWDTNTGFFGSKFVNVIVIKSESGVYEPHSIQLSDEAERLIRLQVIKPSKKDPTKFHVTRNNDQYQYPELSLGEEAVPAPQHTYIDRELFFLLTTFQEVTISKETSHTFHSQLFPSTFHKIKKFGTWENARSQISEAKHTNFFHAVNDFHFLCWIKEHLEADGYASVFERLMNGVKGESEDPLVTSKQLEEFIEQHSPTRPARPSSPPPPLQQHEELPEGVVRASLDALLDKNFDKDLAIQALLIFDGDVGAAANWILDQEFA